MAPTKRRDPQPEADSFVYCKGCEIRLHEFLSLTDNPEQLDQFLINHKVIPGIKYCSICSNRMRLALRDGNPTFVCQRSMYIKNPNKKKVRKICTKSVSQNRGTIFENSNLKSGPRSTICKLIAFWVMVPPPRIDFLCLELKMSRKTCLDWCSCLRQVCDFANQTGEKLGGVGKFVEVDKLKLKRKKECNLKSSWILGGIEQGSKKLFLTPVKTFDKNTLIKVIKEYVLPGTTIITYRLESLGCLENEGYFHVTVNNKKHFVDPVTGAHTQTIVRLWREVQSKLPKYGSRKENLSSHLAEFIFKHLHSNHLTRIHDMFTAIACAYNSINVEERNGLGPTGSSGISTGDNKPPTADIGIGTDSEIFTANNEPPTSYYEISTNSGISTGENKPPIADNVVTLVNSEMQACDNNQSCLNQYF
nr:hypothetical protein BgiMline_025989 [Biomphalaria glabrata]